MKSIQKLLKVFFIYLLLTFSLQSNSFAIQDAIIAVVNDEIITLQDLKSYIKSSYIEFVAQGLSQAQIQKAVLDLEINGLNKLIEDKIILSKANELQLEVRKDLIDERLNEIKASYNSNEEFTQALIKNGGTVNDLRTIIENQLKIKFVIDHQVRSHIYINPQEVTKYYEDNIYQFRKKRRVNVESIFISSKEGKEAANLKADEAIKAIEDGTGINEVVEKYSSVPSIGVLEEGQLAKEIEEEVFYLDVGNVSKKIEVENGIYIFYLTGKIPSRISTLKEVKDNIQRKLFQDKFRNELVKWLEKLKQNAYVEIKQ